MHPLLASARHLSDEALVSEAHRLARAERRATAELVAHLAEMETRDLALRQGYASLFDYCRRALGYSESEAYGRIETARIALRFPAVLDLLAAGDLTMTTAMILGRHLTSENHERLLTDARGRTKEQLREMVAALAPRPDAPVVMRRVPPPAPSMSRPALAPAAGLASAPPPRPPVATIEPLAPQRFRYQVTIDEATRDLLTTARDLSSHGGIDDAGLLRRALQLLVADLARRRFADTDRPRAARSGADGSRHIPAAVRRDTWVRDAGRCAFTSREGQRCEERRFLEFHHVKPYAAGGAATAENIQLRCRAHNQHEARQYFTRDRPSLARQQNG